jgi:NADH:ubiquinone oxidoreductase subunit C
LTRYQLYVKYIFAGIPATFISSYGRFEKNLNLVVGSSTLLFLLTHVKLATPFYSCHMSDILAYEVPSTPSILPTPANPLTITSKSSTSIIVYNLHSFLTQNRLFIFLQNSSKLTTLSYLLNSGGNCLESVTELFPSANWLEREVSELSGISFSGKKDLRNLLLQYGDASNPFRKSFPSIGYKELFYNPIQDTLIQNPISVQL